MVNINKLKGKMVENQIKPYDIAQAMNVSLSTVYRKFTNADSLTVGEVELISRLLELSSEEINSIFFAKKTA